MDKTQREGRVYLGAFYEVEAKIYLRAWVRFYPFWFCMYKNKQAKEI